MAALIAFSTDNVTVRTLYHYGRCDAAVGGSESSRMRAHNQLSRQQMVDEPFSVSST